MKKIIAFIFLNILCLTSCNTTNFNKITLPYVENPRLISINGERLYDLAINQKENLVVIFTVDNCAPCSQAKEELTALASLSYFNIYNVDLTNISQNDYQYIVDASTYANSAYAFEEYGEDLYLPLAYIFAYQGVIITFENYFVDNILTYVNSNA